MIQKRNEKQAGRFNRIGRWQLLLPLRGVFYLDLARIFLRFLLSLRILFFLHLALMAETSFGIQLSTAREMEVTFNLGEASCPIWLFSKL